MNACTFNFIEYEEMVNNYVNEKCSKPASGEKLAGLFDKIIQSETLKVSSYFDFKGMQLVHACIKKIIACKPGRKLFKRLLQSGEKIFIRPSPLPESRFRHTKIKSKVFHHEIYLANNPETYYVTHNSHGNKTLHKQDPACTLFHELTHSLHYCENPKHKNKRVKEGLIDPEMDNLEEQHAISGITKDEQGMDVFDPICENTFHKILGMPLRVNHRGLALQPNEKLGIDPQ